MEKSILLRNTVFFTVLFFLVSPFLYISSYLEFNSIYWDPILIDVVLGASLQALMSTLTTLLFALVGAFGLVSLSHQMKEFNFQLLNLVIILPSFLPPIILIVLGAHSLGFLPSGLWGVVFFHSLMNIGLTSVVLYRSICSKAPPWIQSSLVAGVPLKKIIWKGILPELIHDLFRLSFFLMVLYFFSFSIPLVVGGLTYGGLEVFIYEKIVVLGQWSEAIQYSFGLFILILACSFLLKEKWSEKEKIQSMKKEGLEVFNYRFLTLFTLIPIVFLVIGFSHAILSSLLRLDMSQWLEPMRGTLIIGLVTGALLFSMLSLLAFSFLSSPLSRILNALVNPGWVIVGFSLLLMPGDSDLIVLLKISGALSILYLPYLFRLNFYQSIKDIHNQVQIAQMYSVSWLKIFVEIIWPQTLKPISFLSGLGGLWACGDFALSGILVSSSNMTSLALDMKNLIMNYRLEQALLLLIPLLLSSMIVFLVFQGLYYVSRRNL